MKRQLSVALATGVPLGVLVALIVLNWSSFSTRFASDTPAARVAALRRGADPVAALQDEDADVRLVAAQFAIGSRSVNALIEALRDKHAGVRREAAETLRDIGSPAVPGLCDAVRDEDARVRAAAAFALGHSWKEPRERPPEEQQRVVLLLCELLKDPDVDVRRTAMRVLTQVGWRAAEVNEPVVRACQAALTDTDPDVRSAAARLLERRGPTQ